MGGAKKEAWSDLRWDLVYSLCYTYVMMAKMPTEEDGIRPGLEVEKASAVCREGGECSLSAVTIRKGVNNHYNNTVWQTIMFCCGKSFCICVTFYSLMNKEAVLTRDRVG